MTPHRGFAVALLITVTTLAACDAVYFSRITLREASFRDREEWLEARAKALVIARDVTSEQGHECRVTEDPIFTGSYPARDYAFYDCGGSYSTPDVLVAIGDADFHVEFHDIAGARKPRAFAELEASFLEALRGTFGEAKVTFHDGYPPT